MWFEEFKFTSTRWKISATEKLTNGALVPHRMSQMCIYFAYMASELMKHCDRGMFQ